jgi:hypothetical protein
VSRSRFSRNSQRDHLTTVWHWHVVTCATALRGAATLRGRRSCGHGQNERAEHAGPALSRDDLDFDLNHARSRAALAKGDEMLVAMPDGE